MSPRVQAVALRLTYTCLGIGLGVCGGWLFLAYRYGAL